MPLEDDATAHANTSLSYATVEERECASANGKDAKPQNGGRLSERRVKKIVLSKLLVAGTYHGKTQQTSKKDQENRLMSENSKAR